MLKIRLFCYSASHYMRERVCEWEGGGRELVFFKILEMRFAIHIFLASSLVTYGKLNKQEYLF